MVKQNRIINEVISFIEERNGGHFSEIEVARVLNVTPQAISQMKVKDNMRLSKAEHIAECYGYRLVLAWPNWSEKSGIEPLERKKVHDGAGNLSGLEQYILDSNRTIGSAAQMANIGRGILYRAFSTGDIMLRDLTVLSESLGIEAKWEWIKEE